MKILIAEDDLTSRNILAAMSKKWGFDPVIVKDGIAAWQVMQQAGAPPLAETEARARAAPGGFGNGRGCLP